MSRYRAIALLPVMAALSGCNLVVLNPSGDVASQQGDLVVISTLLMLLIIVPVMALTVLFAWRYRQSNNTARYEPDWDHSTQLELVIWAAPLLIIICLGAITWVTTHKLDPYRPLDRIAADKPMPAGAAPLDVQVVALDWKWLFLYPEYGIASVNEMAAPVDRPIRFSITASSVMNSFYVPALAGQIYAMPGMETKLHAVINEPGSFKGFSANYSGAGFSHMRFTFLGLSDGDFGAWVNKVKAASDTMDRSRYLALEKPSEAVPVQYFGSTDPKLFKAAVERCVAPGSMCMGDMHAIDRAGGLNAGGLAAAEALLRASALTDRPAGSDATGLCTVAEAVDAAAPLAATTLAPISVRKAGTPAGALRPADL
ncbi:ubiquinol oxidase subunit II [Azospirillum picis]|uniref:Ubiquinol oxidase polypeptide II n=1 Tax=Azospirillum picis TaxID=488438 RepID=A0ABU0MK35_9PROT|nr:ubiquinol oxidase subunit II [Azospirillum picis]MBP2299785.1 cytochrome o ubiquinol oxidase subunit 2 [Azospirillum picis]MDQ0533581.1 cytochrome o ubiquinol oxidase subunit 2 [Azospirillum picis]